MDSGMTSMWRARVLTIFPDMFPGPLGVSLLGQALDRGLWSIDAIDIRLHFAAWPREWQGAATWLSERKQGGYVREVLSHFIYLTESVFGKLKLEDAMVRYPDGAGGVAAETHVFADLSCGDIPVSVAGGVVVPDLTASNIRCGGRPNLVGLMIGIRHIHLMDRDGCPR